MSATRGGPSQEGWGARESGTTSYFAERLRHEMSAVALRHHVDQADADFLLVDVRSPADYREGHILGAVNLELPLLVQSLQDEYPGERTLVVYSHDDGCLLSTEAAAALAEEGYRVRLLRGGFSYWKAQGHPVETGDPFDVDDY